MATRYRNICFTVNNWKKEELEALLEGVKNTIFNYIIVAEEVGKEGTPHLQGYAELLVQQRLNAIKKIPGLERAHIEQRHGTQEQAIEYCQKKDTPEDKIHERGNPKKPGQREDLNNLKKKILEGTSVDDIVMDDPVYYHQYGRTMEKMEDIALRKKFRTWMTEGIWLWGPTGVGKSHKAFENFNPDTHYVLNFNDNGWWDGYTGQEIVIFNEFRGQLTFSELLELCDKWPKTVQRRARQPAPFLAKKIIITSSSKPEEIYKNILTENERLDQLLRRFKVIEVSRRS